MHKCIHLEPVRCRIDGEWVFVKALHAERSPVRNQTATYKKKMYPFGSQNHKEGG